MNIGQILLPPIATLRDEVKAKEVGLCSGQRRESLVISHICVGSAGGRTAGRLGAGMFGCRIVGGSRYKAEPTIPVSSLPPHMNRESTARMP